MSEQLKQIHVKLHEQDRFELRVGRFGMYVFDTRDNCEIDMIKCLHLLNKWDVLYKEKHQAKLHKEDDPDE